MADTTTKIIALVSGYGGGKTYIACRKAIQLAVLNPGEDGIITEPTYPMLRDIFIPDLKSALEEWGIPYRFNASNSIFHLDISGVETKILCMSAENYERLVGVNAAWAIMDELDTSKMDIAIKAFHKILGRLRAGTVRQLIITTTPEGFRAVYKIFVTDNQDGKRRLIKAKTTDNKYLPEDFIQTLRDTYSPEMLEAYLNGEFVLMSGTRQAWAFDRDKHHTDDAIKDELLINYAIDFNIGGTCFVVFKRTSNKLIAVDEFVAQTTQEAIIMIDRAYPKAKKICFPDASGGNESANADLTSLGLISQAGHIVNAPKANPSVRASINSVNNLLSKNRLFVNTDKCPLLTQAMESLGYDERGKPEKSNTHPATDDFFDACRYIVHRLYPVRNTSGYVSVQG